jgi:hypothetical protein
MQCESITAFSWLRKYKRSEDTKFWSSAGLLLSKGLVYPFSFSAFCIRDQARGASSVGDSRLLISWPRSILMSSEVSARPDVCRRKVMDLKRGEKRKQLVN